MHYFRFFIVSLIILFAIILEPMPAYAAPQVSYNDTTFSARYVSQSVPDPIQIKQGESQEVVFKFKNTGTSAWSTAGHGYVSAYTIEPKYHDSLFADATWKSDSQTAAITSVVKPGDIGELHITLHADTAPGKYRQQFYLAAENKTWIQGGFFYIDIVVVPNDAPQAVVAPAASAPELVAPANTQTKSPISMRAFQANNFILNPTQIEAIGGSPVRVIVGFQNTGTQTWNGYSILSGDLAELQTSSFGSPDIADESWVDAATIVRSSAAIEPGKFVRETFTIRAPQTVGDYVAHVHLVSEDQLFGSASVEIPITVTQNAPASYTPPRLNRANYTSLQVQAADAPRLAEEPHIRVGLWEGTQKVLFKADASKYSVSFGNIPIGVLDPGVQAVLTYANGTYAISAPGLTFSGSGYIRLEPVDDMHAVFTLENFTRTVNWKKGLNFNKYRGAAEYRVTSDSKATPYIINDLLFSDYVAGIAEVSDGAPEEFIKAQLTAARTYAYYIKEHTTKHNTRNFDVVGSTIDQLYLGYVSEVDMPGIAKAAQETHGYMVTYNDTVVITPYFSRSSGVTRAWSDVWGGENKPWLVPVAAHYDAQTGKSRLGHGVGMSGQDAMQRADKEGLTWDQLLAYYYTGTTVERIY